MVVVRPVPVSQMFLPSRARANELPMTRELEAKEEQVAPLADARAQLSALKKDLELKKQELAYVRFDSMEEAQVHGRPINQQIGSSSAG